MILRKALKNHCTYSKNGVDTNGTLYFSALFWWVCENPWKTSIRTAKMEWALMECLFLLYYFDDFAKIIEKPVYVKQNSIGHRCRQTLRMKFHLSCTFKKSTRTLIAKAIGPEKKRSGPVRGLLVFWIFSAKFRIYFCNFPYCFANFRICIVGAS